MALLTMLWPGCASNEVETQAKAPVVEADSLASLAVYGAETRLLRTLRMDVGRFDEGSWISEPASGYFVADGPERIADRERLLLGLGWNVVRVNRPDCSPVFVPAYVELEVDFVSLPVVTCGWKPDAQPVTGHATVFLERSEFKTQGVRELQSFGFLPDLPRTADLPEAPARWITREEARVICGFFGGRLPTEPEWKAAGGTGQARLGAEGPLPASDTSQEIQDLDGNIAEWAAGEESLGVALGGSWLRPGPRWVVPATARTDEIGFRCAYDAPTAPPPTAPLPPHVHASETIDKEAAP